MRKRVWIPVGLLAVSALVFVAVALDETAGTVRGTMLLKTPVRVQVLDQATGAPVSGARVLILAPGLLDMEAAFIDSHITESFSQETPAESLRGGLATTDDGGHATAMLLRLACTDPNCPVHPPIGDELTRAVVIQRDGYERSGPSRRVARRVEGEENVFDFGSLAIVRTTGR